MKGRLLSVCLLGLGALWACNDHDPHPPSLTDPGGAVGGGGGGGGGGDSTGGVDAGDTDAGVCTDLDEPVNAVDENALSDDAPIGLGGTLVDGVYDLSEADRYVGASGQAGLNGYSYREVIRITGGTSLERNRELRINSGPLQATNATYVIQVTSPSLTLTQRCPQQGATETFSFTVQDGKLTLISAFGESFTYTARP